MSEDQVYRRMQVKVLYSFDNSPTVFLSRSKSLYSVKVAQIPLASEEDLLTLGAFDLKSCVQQIVRSSPENFKLQTEDYAVYYKDITEQPDEPFVGNGVMSSLLSTARPHLIPGRVCQNLSASFLFGDKANSSSLTLEIRLKLHVIDKTEESAQQEERPKPAQSMQMPQSQMGPVSASRMNSAHVARRRARQPQQMASMAAAKATRTKSLPIYYHPPNLQISNIINADKMNAPSKYDSKSILERFNLAPFLLAKIIDKPARKRRRPNMPQTPTVLTPVDGSQPTRAMRTRSMVTSMYPMISSPINEELMSEGSDDTEYRDNSRQIDEEDEEEEEEYDGMQGDSSSPFTPQQPPYKPSHILKPSISSAAIIPSDSNHFQSLPDLEELDSKKTHTIPSTKLPHDHDLACINRNCAAGDSVTWRYFETKFHPNYLNIQRAEVFDKKLYDGMFGPLCNACYLFLRNKGFMRPEAVVKKYLQQQKYKKDTKLKDEPTNASLQANTASSSPLVLSNMPQFHKFATPSHAPSAINEVIRNQNGSNRTTPAVTVTGQTPLGDEYQDLNDFMNQLNNFGGPLTDIDLPHDLQTKQDTPPMMATKSNTRVINLYADENDKENCPPAGEKEFEEMIIKSFSLRSSPDQNDWASFFGEPTPKDNAATPQGGQKTPVTQNGLPQLRTFRSSPAKLNNQKATVVNMPSSPLLTNFENKHHPLMLPEDGSSPSTLAKRTDTTMSYVRISSPHSETFVDDIKM